VRETLMAKQGEQIRAMFGRIVDRYDLLNRLLSGGQDVRWRRVLAHRLASEQASVVLDVCSGTGDVALALYDTGSTLACDFCLPMLARARRKLIRAGRPPLVFAGDALRLPVRDRSVDAITVAFGVRNFESLHGGLQELARALRPGGVLLVLELSRPRGVLAPVLTWWMQWGPALLGRLVSGDPDAYWYLPRSVASFPEGDELCRLMARAGLESPRATRLCGGVATLYEAKLAMAG
jgi:demethylmenaquinone methyltransferase/2-methoxy-6-polyprenyl-1,4-benzoquinol methylase